MLLPLVVWIIFDTRFQAAVACVIVGWLAERAVKAIWRAMLRVSVANILTNPRITDAR